MNLAHLSLQRCPRGVTPRAPTNDERRRAFAALQRPQPNNYRWHHLEAIAYAKAETVDGRTRSTDERL